MTNLIRKNSTSWQNKLAGAITDPKELLDIIGLHSADLDSAYRASLDFPLLATRSYVDKIEPNNPKDPLLLQILPVREELFPVAGFSSDPVGEIESIKVPGLLKKYAGRVLINTTPVCAIHCRYCFRRHFPYSTAGHGRVALEAAAEYIRSDSSITEIILSGGDPLTLGNNRLRELIHLFETIPHVVRLRFHTRLPTVLPERIDAEFIDILKSTRFETVIVIHVNHHREIDQAVTQALHNIKSTGTQLLNQSVLLRGINDQPETLIRLSEVLFSAGVLPYYLHLLDRVQGAGHFEVSENEALQLHEALSAHLSGYLVPRLIREIAGKKNKTPVYST
jgi:EF-P beta-lysylation protein EpmB